MFTLYELWYGQDPSEPYHYEENPLEQYYEQVEKIRRSMDVKTRIEMKEEEEELKEDNCIKFWKLENLPNSYLEFINEYDKDKIDWIGFIPIDLENSKISFLDKIFNSKVIPVNNGEIFIIFK